MSCETCNLIGRSIQSNAPFDSVSLGTYGEMERRGDCATCQQIVAFRAMPPDTNMELMRLRQPASEYQIADEDYTDFMMDIIPLRATAQGQSHGVLFDEEWIDTGRIRAWLGYCEKVHGNACCQLSSVPPVEELLLLDVEKGCLVQKAGEVRYFALSYVWGHLVDTAETRLANVGRLKKPGSITANTLGLNLPETIRDAIRMVQAVGERFLWVDRLCIVQDDHASKAKAIQAMGAIYANAHCTIVAADGQDAGYGLRGIGNGSQPRRCAQQLLNFPHCGPVVQQQEIDTEGRSRWGTRGWTYQEQLCSRRLLMSAENTVAWRCQRAEWREDMTAEPDDDADATRPPLLARDFNVLRLYNWPNLLQWAGLIGNYNRRQLSFVSDTRAAFAGIESIIAPSFPGGFCYGLPEFFFDVALLWQPSRPMARRTTASGSGDGDGYLPSWSCFGWHGSPDPLSYAAGEDYIASIEDGARLRQTSLSLVPLVRWVQLGPLGEAEGGGRDAGRRERRIESRYHVWREVAATDVASELSEMYHTALAHGWRLQNGEGGPWYSHPTAEGAKFKYPVPMPPAPQQQAHSVPSPPPHASWPPLLRLRSKCAMFGIGEAVRGLDMRQVLCVAIRDVSSSRWAGVLRLNQPLIAKVGDLPQHTYYSPRHGECCELVAISQGSASNDADESAYLEEWNISERPGLDGGDECYRFYNVLWIQREADGCVTRKALGRVEMSVWDVQDLKDIDVVLR